MLGENPGRVSQAEGTACAQGGKEQSGSEKEKGGQDREGGRKWEAMGMGFFQGDG